MNRIRTGSQKFRASLILAAGFVALTSQPCEALELLPLLDRVGRYAIEGAIRGLFGVDGDYDEEYYEDEYYDDNYDEEYYEDEYYDDDYDEEYYEDDYYSDSEYTYDEEFDYVDSKPRYGYPQPRYSVPAYPPYYVPTHPAHSYPTPVYPPAYQPPVYPVPAPFYPPAYQAPAYPPAYFAPSYSPPNQPVYPELDDRESDSVIIIKR